MLMHCLKNTKPVQNRLNFSLDDYIKPIDVSTLNSGIYLISVITNTNLNI